MRPEKKPLELNESEKAIYNILKTHKSMPLADLKEAAGLSNKAWDKSLKGLNKLGLTKVVKEDDTLICKLNE